MPIITRVETSLVYRNNQYEIPESLFVKHFGSVEAFEKNHTDKNGMIIQSDLTHIFLEELEETIANSAECVEDIQVESDKHDASPEYFKGKIVKYDRKIERKD